MPQADDRRVDSPGCGYRSLQLIGDRRTHNALPLAIAARLYPQDGIARELSPIARAAHAASLIKVRLDIDFIIFSFSF